MDDPPPPSPAAPPAPRPRPAGLARLWPWGVLLVGGAVSWLLFATRPEPQKRREPERPVEVEALAVRATDYPVRLPSQGTVRARFAGPLASQVAGRVVEVAPGFEDGALVEEGALLVRLEAEDYALAARELEHQLQVADSELAELAVQAKNLEGRQALAKERVELRGDQLQRVQRQREQGVATEDALLAAQVAELQARESRLDLEDSHRALLARQATLRAAREVTARRLARALLDLQRTEVRAPFRARVIQRAVAPGEFVARGATVGELYAEDQLEVRLPLTARQLEFLDLDASEASPVALSATVGEATHPWSATLAGAEARVDASSRQLAVIARVQGDAALRPGRFVSAEITGRTLEGVVVIPRAAALAGREVLVVDREAGVVRRRAIQVAYKGVDELVVSSGLSHGELLCTTPVVFAGDSLKVTVHELPAAEEEPQ